MADLADVSSIHIHPANDSPGDQRGPGTSPRLPKRPLVQKSTEQEQLEEEGKHEVDVTV
jgi:hypothetical protein